MTITSGAVAKPQPAQGPRKRPIKFGTDGWRGIIGETFTIANVRLATTAVAKTFHDERKPGRTVYVGWDHRFRAESFAQEAARVLASYGFKPVVLARAVTSPFLSFVTWKRRAPFGIMITASHNPPEYLGLKVKASFGGSVPQETVRAIEAHLNSMQDDPGLAAQYSRRPILEPKQMPAKGPDHAFVPEYIAYLRAIIDFSVFKGRKSVVMDALYGPGGPIAEALFKTVKTGVVPHFLHNSVDPLFGGVNPEPIEANLSDLKRAVKEMKAAVGFALDGDGDRLGLVDDLGRYLTPQQVFALAQFYLASVRGVRGKLVQTVSMGYLSERIAKDFNLPFEEVPVGFKYVADKMVKEGAVFGAEESGGYAFARTSAKGKKGLVLPERDGLLTALLFLEMTFRAGKPISVLLKELHKRYGESAYLRQDLKLERPVEDLDAFIQKIQKQATEKYFGFKIKEMRTLDGLKIILEDGSWLLARPSGTEPLIRAYAEFPEMSLTQNSLDKLVKLLYNIQSK